MSASQRFASPGGGAEDRTEQGRPSPAPTSRHLARVVIVLAVVTISIPLTWEAIASSTEGAVAVLAGSAVLVIGAYVTGRVDVVLVAAAAATVSVWVTLVGISLWPAPLLAAALVATVVACRTYGGAATAWLRRGQFDRSVVALSVLTIVATSVVLYGWSVWADPDGGPYLESLRENPVLVSLLGILAFSLVNSVCEELLYRGIVQYALTVYFGAVAAVVIQALAFGVLHSSGFPSGLSGIALASIYGAFLGLLRHRSRGLLAPYVVHVCADITIGLIVVVAL